MTGTDGCSVPNSGADNLNDIIYFSSRGPCADGRRKPDAVAPGTHIQGAASQCPGHTGNSVCNKYWPNDGQTWYAWSSGTSHSTPAMAGVAGIIYKWYHTLKGTDPSPAMVKAIMDGISDDMYGGNDGNGGILSHYPDNNQGWGRVNMGRMVDSVTKYTFDQEHVFTASGQAYSPVSVFSVMDTTKPVRIMLAWTDAPGNPNASPSGGLVNNLDLTVTAGGSTYLGNVFSNGWSVTGGSADTINNTEAVYLPAGTATSFTVSISATSLSGDGVPGSGTPTDQDFALFVYNAITDQTSAGIIYLDKPVYGCNDTVNITVSDFDLKDPNASATIAVTIASATEPGGENVTLTQTGANTGVYRGSISTTSSAPPSSGQLSLSNGDTITATYHDADHGGGSPADVTATAGADCLAPVITNVFATNVTDSTATITWLTNENANSRVTYGTSIPPGTNKDDLTNYVTSHSLTLTGLTPCTTYYFSVTSADNYSNSATDNNGGTYYTFTTGQRTYLFGPDNVEGGEGTFVKTGQWHISSCRSTSPTHSWKCGAQTCSGTYAVSTASDLTLSGLNLGATGHGYHLRWNEWYSTETGYDFCTPQISTDGGTTWNNLVSPYSGSIGSFTTKDIDLASYSGTVSIRFHFVSDYSISYEGWYIDDINISKLSECGAPAPNLRYNSNTVTDTCSSGGPGNNDGIIDPSETAVLHVVLINSGNVDATGVHATLTTTTAGITITDDSADYPDIPAGTTAGCNAPHFAFSVGPDIACGTTINFTIHIFANEGQWESAFSMKVGSETSPGGVTIYSENFNNVITQETLPYGWATETVAGPAWYTDDSMLCDGSTFNPYLHVYCNGVGGVTNNAWAYTPGIFMQAGSSYTLSFLARIYAGDNPQYLRITAGLNPYHTSQTVNIWQGAITDELCQLHSYGFTVPTTGVYYIGFKSESDQYGSTTIDNIVLNVLDYQCTMHKCGSSTSSTIVYDSSTTSDSCRGSGSGGDEVLDAGEDIDLYVTIENTSGDMVTGIRGILSTTTPGVLVKSNIANYPDIPGNGTATSAYSFRIGSDVACGTVINFNLHIVSDQGSWDSTFTKTVGTTDGGGETTLVDENFDSKECTDYGLPCDGWDWVCTECCDCIYTPSMGIDSDYFHSSPNGVYGTTGMSDSGARLFKTAGVTIPSSASSAQVSFWMYHMDTGSDIIWVQVQVSTDSGSTWTNVGPTFPTDDGGPYNQWKQHTVDLSSYIGQTIMIGFHMYDPEDSSGGYGNEIHIDDILLTYTGATTCVQHTCAAAVPPEITPILAPDGIFSWSPNSNVDLYNIYRGTKDHLPDLLTGSSNSCLRYQGQATSYRAEDDPSSAPGRFYWYLVTGTDQAGEGAAGNATDGPRIINEMSCQ